MFICRPFPPESVTAVDATITFAPAPELVEWVLATFVEEEGKLFNSDHFHLNSASIGILWTNVANSRKGRRIVGQCEEGNPSGMMGKWGKARAEEQIIGWFVMFRISSSRSMQSTRCRAAMRPEIANVCVVQACGTCQLRVA